MTAAPERRRRVGILGGSFNPVHCGHIALARAIVATGEVDEVWLSLSPLNPLKVDNADPMAPNAHRLAMLRLAVEDQPGLRVCDIELTMPRPSYTIDTLRALSARHPDVEFRLVIGADNYLVFDRWRSPGELAALYHPLVYPRPGYEVDAAAVPQQFTFLPDIQLHHESSTEIRARLRAGLPVNQMLPQSVLNYIEANNLYRSNPYA